MVKKRFPSLGVVRGKDHNGSVMCEGVGYDASPTFGMKWKEVIVEEDQIKYHVNKLVKRKRS